LKSLSSCFGEAHALSFGCEAWAFADGRTFFGGSPAAAEIPGHHHGVYFEELKRRLM